MRKRYTLSLVSLGKKLNFKKTLGGSFSVLFFILFIPCIANATMYAPGATLEPDCAPGSPNCGVLTLSINGQTGAVQTLVVGSAGTDFTIDSTSDVHTFNLPDASLTARGVVSTGSQSFAGNKTFSDNLNIDGNATIAKNLITPRGTDYATTGTQNDVNLGDGSYFHYVGNGTATFTGIAGGVDGRLIRLLNDSSYILTIKNADPGSLVQNQIETPNGADLVIQPDMMIAIMYDSDSNNWHLASQPTTADTVKSFAYINGGNGFGSLASIGTTDAFGLDFITAGATRFAIASNAATLAGTGATALAGGTTLNLTSASGSALSVTSGTTGALNLDSETTGAINLGTNANAKTITIGNTTGATAINLYSGSAGIALNGNASISGSNTFTTGTGLTTINGTNITLAGNSTVIDMSGTGTLGLNTMTNRAITTGTGMFTTGGDLTISGDDLIMGTNTLGSLLVADGTNFNPVILSGDASIASNGILTLNYNSAQSASTLNKGFLTSTDWNTFNGKQGALGFTPENVSNKSTNTVLGTSDTLYPTQKAVKTYVDNIATGLIWQDPVELINVVADTDTPVVSPVHLDGYIINTGGNIGDWSSFAAGDLVQYQTDHWVKIKSMVVGDRFGVAFKSGATPSGSMTGHKNKKVEITGGTPGAFTYTFTAPTNNDALFVQNTNAYYHNVSFTYSSSLASWVQLSASVEWQMGSGLQANGNTASLGPLTADWDQTGAFDINTNGNIHINNGKSLTVAGNSSVSGNVVTPKGANYSGTGTQHDVNLGAGSLFNFTGASDVTITGIAGGEDGRFIRIINTAATAKIILKHQNTGSLNANKIITETGGDILVYPNSAFELSYDAGSSRWRVVVLPVSTAIIDGGNTYGDTADIGTTDNFGLDFITNNIHRFGIAAGGATLTGVGATTITSDNTLALTSASANDLNITAGTTGALNLDSGTTGSINIGTNVNAKTITIGNTTGATAININSGSSGITLDGNTTIAGSNTFTTGTGLTTINGTNITLAGNSTVIDMSGTGTLGLNTTTNRAITTGTGMFTTGGDLTVNGNSTVSGNFIASADFITPFATKNYPTTGTQNDVDLGSGSVISYIGAGTATFTGFTGGVDGKQIRLINNSSSNASFTLNHEDTNSTAENRLLIGSGLPINIGKNGSVTLLYDATISRWRLVQIPASSAIIGAFAFLQNGNAYNADASIGTTDAFGLNFITSGATRFGIASGAATLTGTGATTITTDNTLSLSSAAANDLNITSGTTGALTLDSETTGAINLGTNANAKTINIGTGAAVINNINMGGTGANVIALGNTQTGGSIAMGTAMTSGTITIGGGISTGAINIGVAATTGANGPINIGGNNNGGAARTISIGTSSTGDTINIGVGSGGGSKTINIGTGIVSTTVNVSTGQTGGAINMGTAMTSGTISIGGTGAQTGTITFGGGTGAQTVNLGTGNTGIKTVNLGTGTAANVINVGTGQTAGSINMGTAMTTGTITIGGTGAHTGIIGIGTGTGTQTINIGTGLGNKTINIATAAATQAVTIGAGANASSLHLRAGSGGIFIGDTTGTRTVKLATGLSTQTVTVGSVFGASTLTLEAGTGAINIGTSAIAKTITLGNATGATAVNINSGSGGITLLTATAGNVSIKSDTTGSVTLDSGTTGAVNIGTGNNAKTINIGTGTAGNAINIGTDNTVADTATIGSALDTLNLDAGTINITNAGAQTNGGTVLCLVAGRMRLGAAGTSCDTSSERYKHDINDLTLGLDTINTLRPVNYYYNDNNTYHNGLIAEEVYTAIPTAVILDADGNPNALNYDEIIPVIIHAIKEQSVLMGDISPKKNPDGSDNGLSTLIETIQNEIAVDPVILIGQYITDEKRFLTNFVAARVTAIRGYFDEIFTKKIHTEQLCVKKSDGSEVCVNGDQIDALLQNTTPTSTPPSVLPDSIPAPTETTTVTDPEVPSVEPTPVDPIVEPAPEVTPTDTPTDVAPVEVVTPPEPTPVVDTTAPTEAPQ